MQENTPEKMVSTVSTMTMRELLERLRPKAEKVQVAAFNSSI
jgi:hypothetical protein